MNYIESEMSKRHRPVSTDPTDSHPSNQNEPAGRQSTPDLPQREPASLGKLHEIDLGHETKLRNIARTEAATKKLTDDDVVSEDSASKSAPPKEEKRRKNRKRRNSEDAERDRLVEEVLRESKRASAGLFAPGSLLTLQWTFTMNPRKSAIQMTRRPMTRSLNNSGVNSSMPSSHGAVSPGPKTQSQPKLNPPKGPNWEAVAVRGRRCGRCRRKARNDYSMGIDLELVSI